MKKKALTFSVLILVLFIGLPVMAQSGKAGSNKSSIVLDDDKMELAEDIRDILEQLEKLIHDYQQYFSENNNHYAARYKRALLKMLLNIDNGNYVNDVDLLLDDISDFKQELLEREEQTKNDPEQKKFYRNVRSLHTQLELLEEFINEDIDNRIKQNEAGLPQIKAYLKQEKENNEVYNKYIEQVVVENQQLWEELKKQSEGIKALLKESYKVELTEKEVQEIQQAVSEATKALKVYEMIDPELYVYPDVPDVTLLYHPDSVTPPHIVTFTENSDNSYRIVMGNVLTKRDLKDSLEVNSSEEMIFIDNLTGDLEIRGHNSNKVLATVDVQVMADNVKKADEFIDQIQIKLMSNKDGIYVSPRFPELTSSEQKILKSKMTIYVPKRNKVVCETSFGQLNVKDLNNGIDIEARHCQLYLKSIRGGTKIINSSGISKLYSVDGTIDLKSSLGPVILKNCNGDLEINNTYADVELSGCQGTTRIQNSGRTSVSDHIGKVEIKNSNGVINVSDHRGDLIAETSFKPLILSNIKGNIDITNVNASINVTDAVGKVIAKNKFGSIDLKELSGPVDLYNNSGSISMTVDEYYKGTSEIDSDYGSVNLVLNPNSNIFVSANSEGGTITSAFNSRITQNNLGSSTKLTLGKGSSALNVKGTNSVIVIEKSL